MVSTGVDVTLSEHSELAASGAGVGGEADEEQGLDNGREMSQCSPRRACRHEPTVEVERLLKAAPRLVGFNIALGDVGIEHHPLLTTRVAHERDLVERGSLAKSRGTPLRPSSWRAARPDDDRQRSIPRPRSTVRTRGVRSISASGLRHATASFTLDVYGWVLLGMQRRSPRRLLAADGSPIYGRRRDTGEGRVSEQGPKGELARTTANLIRAGAAATPVTAVLAELSKIPAARRERRWRFFLEQLLVSWDQELDELWKAVADERITALLERSTRCRDLPLL